MTLTINLDEVEIKNAIDFYLAHKHGYAIDSIRLVLTCRDSDHLIGKPEYSAEVKVKPILEVRQP